MQINIKAIKGTILCLDVSLNDTIDTLKAKIRGKEGIPIHQQQLFFGEKKLENGFTLKDYSIQNNSTIDLIIVFRITIRIFKKTYIRNYFNLDVSINETIEDIKTKIQEKEGIPREQQQLIFGGKQLENCFTLKEYSIQNNSKLVLVVDSGKRMLLYIKTIRGTTISFDVEPNDQIGDIKSKIQEKEGIPVYQIGLKFRWKVLEDDFTLKDYSIAGDSTLFLFLKLRSG